MAYTKEDKKIIKRLTEAGLSLTGEETAEELKNLASGQDIKDEEGDQEEIGEREEIEGVPENLPPQYQLDGHGKRVAVHFHAAFKGGAVVYGPNGKRLSAVIDSKYAARSVAHSNTELMKQLRFQGK